MDQVRVLRDDVEMAGSDAIGQVFDDVEDSSDGRHRSTESDKRARRGREGPSSRNAVARGPARLKKRTFTFKGGVGVSVQRRRSELKGVVRAWGRTL